MQNRGYTSVCSWLVTITAKSESCACLLVYCFHFRSSIKLRHKDTFFWELEMNIKDYFKTVLLDKDNKVNFILWAKVSAYMYLNFLHLIPFLSNIHVFSVTSTCEWMGIHGNKWKGGNNVQLYSFYLCGLLSVFRFKKECHG